MRPNDRRTLEELLAILECDPDSELPDVQTQERELAEAGVSVERSLVKLRALLEATKGKSQETRMPRLDVLSRLVRLAELPWASVVVPTTLGQPASAAVRQAICRWTTDTALLPSGRHMQVTLEVRRGGEQATATLSLDRWPLSGDSAKHRIVALIVRTRRNLALPPLRQIVFDRDHLVQTIEILDFQKNEVWSIEVDAMEG